MGSSPESFVFRNERYSAKHLSERPRRSDVINTAYISKSHTCHRTIDSALYERDNPAARRGYLNTAGYEGVRHARRNSEKFGIMDISVSVPMY